MLVAICDDAKLFREKLRSVLYTYKAERRLHIDVYLYASGEALLADLKAFDMVFLDYQMPGMDGMAVARELRRRNLTCSIVFISSYDHFVCEAFEVQTYRFLKKPITPEQIEALMTNYIAQQKLLAPIVVFDDCELRAIHPKDILYLQADGKYCAIHTTQERYLSSKSLSQLYPKLPQHCFYRSHKSYAVNLYSISSFNRGTATLINGETARIGRSKAGEFRRIYTQFIKDYYVKI